MTPEQAKTLDTILTEQRKLRGRLDEIRRAEVKERKNLNDTLAKLIQSLHGEN